MALLRRAQAAVPGRLLGQPAPGGVAAKGDAARAGRGGAIPDGRSRFAAETVRAALNLGHALKGKGQVDEAIACYRKAIELDPKYAAAHNNLGAMLCDKRPTTTEAIACFKKAIELDPKSA